jgi:hypothetical protein
MRLLLSNWQKITFVGAVKFVPSLVQAAMVRVELVIELVIIAYVLSILLCLAVWYVIFCVTDGCR